MSDVFITENFLLQNDRAVELYHRFARDLPIIDYHCHLPPRQIAEDHRFENLAADLALRRSLQVAGDAGGRRARSGIARATPADWEKFEKWAEVVPQTLRNPLYHWTHLELKRPLGISDRLLGPATGRGHLARVQRARSPAARLSCRGIMRQMNVVLVCTTDDPIDSLEHHAAIAADTSFPIQRAADVPARPGDGRRCRRRRSMPGRRSAGRGCSRIDIGDAFRPLISTPCGSGTISFTTAGCRLSDHGVETFDACEGYAVGGDGHLRRGPPRRTAVGGGNRRVQARPCSTSWPLMDHARRAGRSSSTSAPCGTTIRGCSSLVGADTGFDSIGDAAVRPRRCRDSSIGWTATDQLAKTILYNLNPAPERGPGHDDRQFPGRQTCPARCSSAAAGGSWTRRTAWRSNSTALSNLGLAEPVRGHVDRQPFVPFLHAARVLPPHPLQPIRHGNAAGPRA